MTKMHKYKHTHSERKVDRNSTITRMSYVSRTTNTHRKYIKKKHLT